jgi:hypothetical protein
MGVDPNDDDAVSRQWKIFLADYGVESARDLSDAKAEHVCAILEEAKKQQETKEVFTTAATPPA